MACASYTLYGGGNISMGAESSHPANMIYRIYQIGEECKQRRAPREEIETRKRHNQEREWAKCGPPNLKTGKHAGARQTRNNTGEEHGSALSGEMRYIKCIQLGPKIIEVRP